MQNRPFAAIKVVIKKCIGHLCQGMSKLLSDEKPEALLFYGEPTEQLEEILQSIPTAVDLPRYQYHDIETIEAPRCLTLPTIQMKKERRQ